MTAITPYGVKNLFTGYYMDVGQYFEANHSRIANLSENNWKVALKKCKDHLRSRLFQKTLSGVYSSSNLGAQPIDHYLSFAVEKILSGAWEWKAKFSLGEQMIRIVDSEMSKEVERKNRMTSHLSNIKYIDNEELQFYQKEEQDSVPIDLTVNRVKLESIEKACKDDYQLEFIVEGLKEGKKRTEIAELLEITPRQFDKLREKLIRRIESNQS